MNLHTEIEQCGCTERSMYDLHTKTTLYTSEHLIDASDDVLSHTSSK